MRGQTEVRAHGLAHRSKTAEPLTASHGRGSFTQPAGGRRLLIHIRDTGRAFPLTHTAASSQDLAADAPATRRTLTIGIAGGSGSGKSTVARNVAGALGTTSVAFIDMDAYYHNYAHLPAEERRRMNWDHPDAFDWELLVSQLARLAAGEPIDKPVYDFVTHTRRVETTTVQPADVIVIDGILLFADERVRELCDIKVFVDADPDIRLIRRIRRDMTKRGRPLDEILDQYVTTVQPMHLQFVEPSKRYADVIVPRGGHNQIAIEMIVAKIQRRVTAAGA
jgi:uridine kinase